MLLTLLFSSLIQVKAADPKPMNVVFCEMIKVKLQDKRISEQLREKYVALYDSLKCQ